MARCFMVITVLAMVCIPSCFGCTCPSGSDPHMTPRAEIFCRSHHVIKGKLLQKRAGQFGMIDHTFIVIEVFKGSPEFQIGDVITYKSPRSSMQCGVTGLEENVTYVISGEPPYPGFGYGITLCQWVQEYDDLNSEEKKGLRRKYQRTCSA